uniref:Venom peptide HtAPx n=1 Tax=Hadogenes troglodytes TaxID=1577150 RepID=A0A1B3IJ64_9SCOR|nr:venom peptide HtAPx [Hadogenes troglodytes]
MNTKAFFAVVFIAMLVTDQAEAGFFSTIGKWASKAWNSDIGKSLRNKAAGAINKFVSDKIGVTPEKAGSMTLDEIVDALSRN